MKRAVSHDNLYSVKMTSGTHSHIAYINNHKISLTSFSSGGVAKCFGTYGE